MNGTEPDFKNYLSERSSRHSSMVSTAACYRVVPGSNPGKGENLLISDLKGNLNNSNLNTIIVWVYELIGLV